jgi:chorismate synthase
MSTLRFLTAGESHGPALTAILDGLPAGLTLLAEHFARDLQRRKLGYGRGGRMAIEPEMPKLLSGLRHGRTLGTPLSILIENADHPRAWATRMAPGPIDDAEARGKEVSLPRPGHADATGAIKFGHRDLRNSLERASARETAMRVALGAAARRMLDELDISVGSFVLSIGPARARTPEELALLPGGEQIAALLHEDAQGLADLADQSEVRCLSAEDTEKLTAEIVAAQRSRDTVGGIFEVRVTGLPPGVGTFTQSDLRLDGRLARALAAVQAIKAVEIGDGWAGATRFGSQVHDPMLREGGSLVRPSNHAGGLEGGTSNGEPLIVRAAMKPIATLSNALASVDLRTGEPDKAHVERSDTCAVPAAAVIGEAVVALELGAAVLEKLGGDSMQELHAALRQAWRRARLLPGHVFLCGLPGAGKSTVLPLLAVQLGLPAFDLDDEITRASGMTIPQIFAAEGETGFRAREAAAVRKLAKGPRAVIALGGGALGTRGVRLAVRRTGHLLWLSVPHALCAARAASTPGSRPLLAGDLAAKLHALSATREPLYLRLADARVDGSNPDETALRLAERAAAAVNALEAERAWA